MLGTHGLLTPHSEEPACYFNSTLESRKDVQSFVKKLYAKNLRMRQVRGQYFFRTPFELFAAIFEGTRGDAARISRDLKNFILQFPTWSNYLPELAFLETNQKILLYFVSHPELIILSGLCLVLLAVMFKTRLKVYQMYQRSSLMSFELAGGLSSASTSRIGVFLFGDAISYCVLDKSKAMCPTPSVDSLMEYVRSSNLSFKPQFSKIEIEIIETLLEHMGPYSQLLLNFAHFTQVTAGKQHELQELVEILNAIRHNMSEENRETINGRVLRIESLGLEGIHPSVKAELIFGPKISSEILTRSSQVAVGYERPPGLKDKYSEGIHSFNPPTLDAIERFENFNFQNGEKRGTPETHETVHRKHSFEVMNPIPEQAEEHLPNPPAHPAPPQPLPFNSPKNKRFSGTLKFVDEKKEYGFFLKDVDKTDVFFHFSELKQAGIPLQVLKDNKGARVTFAEVEYVGKNNKKSKKAIEIQLPL